MIALIDRDMHGKLNALRAEMRRARVKHIANVFVPVGAVPASAGAPRVLFVGKATSGWKERRLDSFDGSKRVAESVVKEWLPNGKTAFWQFARAVLRQALRSCEIKASDAELPSFCGWSNLAKIGSKKIGSKPGYAPPTTDSLNLQKELCIKALRSEVARFKPTAVVLLTNDYAEKEIAFPVFGPDGWRRDTSDKGRVGWKFHEKLRTVVIRANHPQGMRPSGTRASVQKVVAELIVRATKGRSLPRGVITHS